MGLTADEKKLLEELTAKSKEPDVDEAFEIEIFDGSKGARVPYSQGKKWLFDNFGLGEAPEPPSDGGDGGQGDGGGGQGGDPTPRSGYFKRTTGSK